VPALFVPGAGGKAAEGVPALCANDPAGDTEIAIAAIAATADIRTIGNLLWRSTTKLCAGSGPERFRQIRIRQASATAPGDDDACAN